MHITLSPPPKSKDEISEDGKSENPGNSGNDKAECIIDCIVFCYKKRRGGEYYWSKTNSDHQHAGKKGGFLSYGSALGKFVS